MNLNLEMKTLIARSRLIERKYSSVFIVDGYFSEFPLAVAEKNNKKYAFLIIDEGVVDFKNRETKVLKDFNFTCSIKKFIPMLLRVNLKNIR